MKINIIHWCGVFYGNIRCGYNNDDAVVHWNLDKVTCNGCLKKVSEEY